MAHRLPKLLRTGSKRTNSLRLKLPTRKHQMYVFLIMMERNTAISIFIKSICTTARAFFEMWTWNLPMQCKRLSKVQGWAFTPHLPLPSHAHRPPRTAEHNVTNEQAASHEAAMRGVAEQQDAFELEKSRMGKIFEQQQEKVKLDVGGQRFSTSMTTLLSIPESIFSSYVPFWLRKHTVSP